MRPTLAEFAGKWQLRREIRQGSGADAVFEGVAVLFEHTEHTGGLLYEEDGQLQITGQRPMTATRRYLWQVGEGERIDIFFEDGRPFHTIAAGGVSSKDRHYCDPDTYDVQYDFSLWPEWHCRWHVTGPRKDYRMHSVYTRA